MLEQIIQASEYDFKSVDGFELNEVGETISYYYYGENMKPEFDFTLISRGLEECLAFIEDAFLEAKKAQEYILELSF